MDHTIHGILQPQYWMGSLSLLQGIFPTQGSNPGLPHCRQILYQLSHRGNPRILEWVAYPFSRGSSSSFFFFNSKIYFFFYFLKKINLFFLLCNIVLVLPHINMIHVDVCQRIFLTQESNQGLQHCR